jgi:hypothetical protein
MPCSATFASSTVNFIIQHIRFSFTVTTNAPLAHKQNNNPAVPRNATFASSAVNIVNNIIGSGLLTLPWALREASVAGGLALLTVVGVTAAFSFHLLARCCVATGVFRYV